MDIRSEVYHALAKIMVRHKNVTRTDMEQAIEWFEIHFWDNEESDEGGVEMPQHNWWEPGCEDMPKVAPKEQWLPEDEELPFV